MKNTIIVGAVAIVAGLTGFWLLSSNNQNLDAANEQMLQQLLGDIEQASLRRIENEKRIDELNRTISELRSQVASANSQREAAEQQANPEYEVMERQIRREVTRELQSRPAQRAALTKSDLVRHLNDLDPVEVGEIMSLQSQYGSFLQALDVSDERMDVIVDGISDMVAGQNQARMELLSQMREQAIPPQDLRSKMLAIGSPDAQRDALSFILTDDEMAVFNETLTRLPQVQNLRTFTSGSTSTFTADGPVFFGTRQIAPNGAVTVDIISSDPQ